MQKYKYWLKMISGFMVLMFIIILCRLVQLQILLEPINPTISQVLDPKRGRILDRNLQEMAITIEADSIYCMKGMPFSHENARKLSNILGKDYRQLYKKIRSNRSFVLVARNITYKQKTLVEKLNNPFLKIVKESNGKRAYPKMELAAHVIGFTGVDNNGLEGIENTYDSFMRGKQGKMITERDAWGRTIISKNRNVVSTENGADIVVTIDNVIEHIAEQELKKVYLEYNANGGSVIVMDPHTGEILAMANVPSYNPNEFRKYKSSNWRNRAITDTFEPGSTMKIFTAIAALEEGVVKREEVLNCEKNNLVVEGHLVRDSKDHPPRLTFQQVLEKSSNIGIVQVALRLGKTRIYNYFRKFGFGDTTGIDLQGEVKGKLISPLEWSGTSITAIPIGQEIAVNTVQLARGISIVANGGYEVKPYVIKEIRTPQGKVIKKFNPIVGNKIVSLNTLKEIDTILKSVTEEGSGKKSKMDDYTSGVKTGTAQKFIQGKGGYASGEIVFSYVGYAPSISPKIAIVIVLDSPEKKGWAESVIGPVFKNIAQRTLHYLNVLPDRFEEHETIEKNKNIKINEPELLIAQNNTEKIMPSVLGMSIRRTMDILSRSYMDVKIVGSGVAVRQDPSPGSRIEEGGTCIVYFAQK
ncbi:MAG: transpeptidase family protein [Candidatus Firestonebacteria bacterium]|nr:transpeptidase family protein [Candidatus Firestonebacteria bacterium]